MLVVERVLGTALELFAGVVRLLPALVVFALEERFAWLAFLVVGVAVGLQMFL